MWKFILCSFAFLGWGFYELSGGSDFEAPAPRARVAANLSTYEIPEGTTAVVVEASLPETVATQVETAAVELAITSGLEALETYTPETTQPTTPETAVETVAVTPVVDLRQVTGNRVNMRNGPSTNFQVLAKLTRGDEVEVLQIPGDGWVKLRVVESGRIGWMAERLLTASAN